MNTNRTSITRRQALKTVAATALGAGLAGQLAAQDPQAAKPAPSLPKPTLHVYDNYGWLRRTGHGAIVGRPHRGCVVVL